MHGLGITEALAGLPEWVVVLFALITQLGDPWFVFSVVSLLYWLGDDRIASRPRHAGAMLIALGLVALGATIGFKSLFAFHRPPGAGTATPPAWLPGAFGSLFVDMSTGDGFGFPSGHALGATVVYGGAAVLCDRLFDRRRRYGAAAFVIGLVALSRLVIGVHHLLDVVAGVLVGLAVLAFALRVADTADRPDRAYLLGAVLSVGAMGVAVAGGHTGETYEAAIGLGSAVGGAVGWNVFDERVRVTPGIAVVSLAVFGSIWGFVYKFEPTLPGTALGSAIAVGGIVAVPGLVGRMRKKRGVGADGA